MLVVLLGLKVVKLHARQVWDISTNYISPLHDNRVVIIPWAVVIQDICPKLILNEISTNFVLP